MLNLLSLGFSICKIFSLDEIISKVSSNQNSDSQGCYIVWWLLIPGWQLVIHFQGKPFNITAIQAYAPTSNAEEAEVEQFYEDLQDLLELTPKKDVLFIIGDWNAKVGSQETPGVTSKFGLGVWNEAGQMLIEFCQQNTLVIANTLFQQHKKTTHGHHQMIDTEIRLIIFFAAKDGDAPHSQQKQDQELTVTQIMNSILPN